MINEPHRHGRRTAAVYLKDIWPTNEEVRDLIDAHEQSTCSASYADVYEGDARWHKIAVTGGETYSWPAQSTYIQNPPYFTGMTMQATPPSDIIRARARSPCSAIRYSTTDHIFPAGAIKA